MDKIQNTCKRNLCTSHPTPDMLTTSEIIKKVRLLEIKSKKLTTDLFTGEYHSAFKGKGMSFKEVREYAAGDDIRFIDWNVSARFGHPFSKVFEEERELTVMLLVDISGSSLFGTVYARKRDLITEIAAVISFSAVNNGDKIGVIFYSDKVEAYIPPKKGRQHALYIVRELLSKEPKGKGTQVSTALRFFNNSTRQKSIAFILSDFLDANYEQALRIPEKSTMSLASSSMIRWIWNCLMPVCYRYRTRNQVIQNG